MGASSGWKLMVRRPPRARAASKSKQPPRQLASALGARAADVGRGSHEPSPETSESGERRNGRRTAQ